jgi:DNA-binding NarL/FixJ family response regulator
MKPSMLIVDDHPLLLAGLREALAEDYRIEYASSAPIAEMMLASDRFDIVLFDFYLGQQTSVDLMRIVREKYPTTRLCLITHDVTGVVVGAAAPFVPEAVLEKSLSFTDIRQRVQHVISGGRSYDDKVVIELFRLVEEIRESSGDVDSRVLLTEEQKVVLKLTANGMRAKEIADELGLSIATVNHVRRDIKNALRLESLAEMISYVHERRDEFGR